MENDCGHGNTRSLAFVLVNLLHSFKKLLKHSFLLLANFKTTPTVFNIFTFFNCYTHCFNIVPSIVCGALESVDVLRRLRSCRYIIVINVLVL